MGFFILCIYVSYSYAFYIGGIYVDYPVYNDLAERNYSAGDSISVFFGVLFGLFSLASTSPALTAMYEGKAAAKLALDVINRTPLI